MNNLNSVESMIHNIVTVVFRIHFYYVKDPDLEMDLKQEGYLKAYELLASGNYDPSKNLRTFIYTGVRNAMTNYMYHHNKENHTDLEVITSQTWQHYESITMDDYYKGKLFYEDEVETDKYNISQELVEKVVNKYYMFGDYKSIILRELSKVGLYEGKISESNEQEIPLVTSAILGEIYYSIFMN